MPTQNFPLIAETPSNIGWRGKKASKAIQRPLIRCKEV
jgi:hypothetical protein